MKKIMAMMIGLGLMMGTVAMFAADEKPADEKSEKKGKKGKKSKKKDEQKAPPAA